MTDTKMSPTDVGTDEGNETMRNTGRRRIAAVAIAAGMSLAMTGVVGCAQGDGSASPDTTTSKKVGVTDADGGIWVPTAMHAKYRTDSDGDGKYDMSSSDDVELTVDENGNITAVRAESKSDSTENDSDSYVIDTKYEYDENGFLTAYETKTDGEVLSSCDFDNEFDKATGNIAKSTITQHDALSKEDAETENDKAECTYEYDANGNLTKFSESGLTLTFREDGQLESADGGFVMTYLYDDDGHLVGIKQTMGEDTGSDSISAKTDISSKYDDDGNLVSYTEISGGASSPSTEATYEYTYIANPSKGARTYAHGWRTLIQFL